MLSALALRHGECEANLAGIYAGHDDSPLTGLGRQQAAQAADSVAASGIVIARIVSSPLSRAFDTACAVADAVGIDREQIQTDSRILERDMGEISGKLKSEVPTGGWLDIPGVETPDAFQDRVLDFFTELAQSAQEIAPAQTLVVSHAGVICMLDAIRLRIPASQFFTVKPPRNAEAVSLDLSWLLQR